MNYRTTCSRFIASSLAVMAMALSSLVWGADYPTRPVRIVTGSPPGSSTDVVLRQFAEKLAQEIKTPVVVDSKPGANGVIATMSVAGAPPDGYTLLFTASLPAYPMLSKAMTKDPVKDYVAISELLEGTLAISVSPESPWKTVDDMIAEFKSKPGRFNFALASGGGVLLVEMFKAVTETDFAVVRYAGEAPASRAVMANESHWAINQIGQAKAYADSGRLRILGVMGPKRHPLLPDVPAFGESKSAKVRDLSKFTGFYSFWYGLFAPANTPKNIVATLNAASVKILKDPEFVERMKKYSLDPVGNSPEEFANIIARETEVWRKVAKDSKIEPQ